MLGEPLVPRDKPRMSDFAQFIQILWEIVRFLLDVFTYTVCAVLALASCVLPWRAVACLLEQDHSRQKCVYLFFRTVFEIICLALCLPSLLVPTRLVGFLRTFTVRELREEMVRPQGDIGYALWWAASPFQAIAEVLCYGLGLVALVTVIRSCKTVNDARDALREPFGWTPNFCHGGLLGALGRNGLTALLDIFFLPVLLVLLVTVWRARPAVKEMCRGFGWVTRAMLLRQFVCLLQDLLVLAPSGLLVLLAPWRLRGLRHRLRGLLWGADRQEAPASGAEAYARVAQHDDSSDDSSDDGENEAAREERRKAWVLWSHCWKLPRVHYEFGRSACLVVLDLLCSPLVLVLLLTVYRFPSILGWLEGRQFHRAVFAAFGNLVLDLPFLVAGLVTICSIYRADLVLRLCRRDARSDWSRRQAAGWQFLRLLGDAASLLPLAAIACTLYRLPAFLLGLKVRMVPLLFDAPEMEWEEWSLTIPQPRGRPTFLVRAAKSTNLGGVRSMRLQVAGGAFWDAVALSFGGLKAAAGQAMLPHVLRDGVEVDFSVIQRGRSSVSVAVQLQCTTSHRFASKVVAALSTASNPDVEVLLQLEGTVEGWDAPAVLLAVPVTMQQVSECLASESAVVQAPQEGGEEEREEAMLERVMALRGEQTLGRDEWLPTVMKEFGQILFDAVHLFIAMLLLLAPWRLVSAAWSFLQSAGAYAARRARRVGIALEGWDRCSKQILSSAQCVANRFAKHELSGGRSEGGGGITRRNSQTQSSDAKLADDVEGCIAICCCLCCPCCPNYGALAAGGDWEVHHHRRRRRGGEGAVSRHFDQQLGELCKPLHFHRSQLRRARKEFPDGPEWLPISEQLDCYISKRSEAFYWMLLLHEVHILMARGSISRESHSRVSQAIRARALSTVQGAAEGHRELLERLREQCQEAAGDGEWGWRKKTKAILFAALREQLVMAITDFLAVPALLLLCVSMYRLPLVCEDLGSEWDVTHLKMVLKRHVLELFNDVLALLQLLFLVAILTVTFIKLPDFLCRLRPSRGLQAARTCALVAFSELVVGIMEMLLMLTAWKTYRLLVSALVFGALSPATMLAASLPNNGCGGSSKVRFWLASALWLGLLAAAALVDAPYVLPAAVAMIAAAFAGYAFNSAPGWTRPRGGADWWSEVVRFNFPNVLAIVSIAADAAVLAWLGREGGKGSGLERDQNFEILESIALSVVGLAVVLETLPMVSDEEDRQVTLTGHFWRAGTALTREVLLLPSLLVLAAVSYQSRLACIALLFLLSVALLGPAIWDVDLPRESLLDIRHVGMAAGMRKLLLFATIFAAVVGHQLEFYALLAACSVWTVAGMLLGWCSVRWVEVLRLGAIAGASVGLISSHAAAVAAAWAAAGILSLMVCLRDWLRRRQILSTSDVPAAMQHLLQLHARLCVWGTAPPRACAVDADVKSTAFKVLEFEEQIPVECVEPAFLEERRSWQEVLRDAPDYAAVLVQIKRLEAMIRAPMTRVLLKQVLAKVATDGRKLDHVLAREIVHFTVPKLDFFPSPQPVRGWEYGKLDLAQLREQAARAAKEMPARLRLGPTVTDTKSTAGRVRATRRRSNNSAASASLF